MWAILYLLFNQVINHLIVIVHILINITSIYNITELQSLRSQRELTESEIISMQLEKIAIQKVYL
jgi:hypothetical protein